MRYAATMILVIALCGCGGGGGSDGGSAAEDYTGVWSGRMGQLDNVCVAAGLGDFNLTMTVNQDGDRVVVDTSTGATYEGSIRPNSVNHEDELDVVKPVACSEGVGQTTTEIVLSKQAGEDDSGTGVVEVTTTCGGGSLSCRWVGNMTRPS
jgi:hypothetical protein